MISDLNFAITADLWLYQGKGGWHFITLPFEESEQIKFFASTSKRGWGVVRVTARIGATVWKTSLFPDSKSRACLLPIKADVRKKEKIGSGDTISVQLEVSV